MSEVFILGAGFSKAISSEMPLVKELSALVLKLYRRKDFIESDVRRMMEEDFEKTLTYLSQEKPWLHESENLRHKALYLDLTNVIRGIIHEKSRCPLTWGSNQPDLWIEALITYWHNNRCIVITLNYDTLIECVASAIHWRHRSKPIPTGQLYPIPFTPVGQRGTTIVGDDPVKTFKFFKLHGSINWVYSGRSDFFGEELFYVPCSGGLNGSFDDYFYGDPEKSDWGKASDKSALIIPPTLDKSAFFQHESLRSMWLEASREIKNASKIICMGYSLPMSDLTMAQFLKTSAPIRQIPFELVDISPKCSEHFSNVLGNGTYNFRQEITDEDCIPKFVVKNCVSDEEDKKHVIRMSRWNTTTHLADDHK
jgi:hypothetical protein